MNRALVPSPTECQECHMLCDPGEYHPHLYCIIWRAYRIDPERVLRDHGFTRRKDA